MKTDSVYVILWHKGKKVRNQLFDIKAYKKKSDAKKFLKNMLKEKHKECEKSEYWEDVEDSYVFIDAKKNKYCFWIEELMIF